MFNSIKEKVKAARKDNQLEFLALDLIMLGLIILNLTLIAIEWLYLTQTVNGLLLEYLPEVHAWYGTYIHEYFFEIDLVFVAIFIAELFFRWGIAIYRDTYHKWFFYPFIHWYDVLGCIPMSSFRVLRLFRIFSMVYRLERMNIISLRKTYIFRLLKKYYNIFVEEITDRVVINILDGVKKEVQGGNVVFDRIMNQVVSPRKDVIIHWLGGKIGSAATHTYDFHRPDIQRYVDGLISKALEENKELSRLELVPVLGSYVTSTIEKAVTNIVFNVINTAVSDIASNRNELVTEVADLIFETVVLTGDDEQANELVIGIFSDVLDILKDKVAQKDWLLDELEQNRQRIRREVEEEMQQEKTEEELKAGSKKYARISEKIDRLRGGPQS